MDENTVGSDALSTQDVSGVVGVGCGLRKIKLFWVLE